MHHSRKWHANLSPVYYWNFTGVPAYITAPSLLLVGSYPVPEILNWGKKALRPNMFIIAFAILATTHKVRSGEDSRRWGEEAGNWNSVRSPRLHLYASIVQYSYLLLVGKKQLLSLGVKSSQGDFFMPDEHKRMYENCSLGGSEESRGIQ